MGYWNWIHNIYDYEDAVREYVDAKSEASALWSILDELGRLDLIYNEDGSDWNDKFKKSVEMYKEGIK